MESIQPEKKAGYDLQEELILDDWIAEQEMKGQVVKRTGRASGDF